jgi:tetratricopeptide (TPR) repeat protein
MTNDSLQTLIEDATADFALGDSTLALEKLSRATTSAPHSFEAWHALAEVNFSLRHFDAALEAAEHAHRLKPERSVHQHDVIADLDGEGKQTKGRAIRCSGKDTRMEGTTHQSGRPRRRSLLTVMADLTSVSSAARLSVSSKI